MAENMKENMLMIRKKDKVSSFGLMVESMMEDGKTENKTALVLTLPQAEKLSRESGKMEKDSIGSKITNEMVCVSNHSNYKVFSINFKI